MHVKSVSLIAVQTDSYDAMVRFYREVMGLEADFEEQDLTEFALPNGDLVTVYGPRYRDDRPYTTGPCPALFVDDVPAARADMEAVGVEFIGPTLIPEEYPGWAYAHYRAPDGNLYRIMSRPEGE